MTDHEWSVSGLCVTTWPERLTEVEALLNRQPGFEVHARDPKTGKLVVVQERATIEEHREGLRQLQKLPDVLTAELVLHYQDPESEDPSRAPGGAS